MRQLKELVRPNITALTPYSSARDEYEGNEGIFLDANENPFGRFNRYPDPQQRELKNKVSRLRNIPVEQIFIGNGSDEIIDLCYRIFCRPGLDKAITFVPTYGMYEISATINDIELIKLPLDKTFQIQFDTLTPYLNDQAIKLLIICSPNNPTGNILKGIDIILNQFSGIVVIDEAYIDFSKANSWVEKLSNYPNLIVCQTLSKAYGLAAIRIGLAFANSKIVNIMNRVKPPYNVSTLNQRTAVEVLDQEDIFIQQKELLITERERVALNLLSGKLVKKIHPSETNFLLVEVANADSTYKDLIAQRIITRNRSHVVKNCIRITIGTVDENNKLLAALNSIAHSKEKTQYNKL